LVGFRTETGGRWHGLFLENDEHGIWRLMGKTRGKLRAGETITLVDRNAQEAFRLTLLTPLEGGQWAAQPDVTGDPLQLLARVGRVPLPPYIRDGQMVAADIANYQTVFAVHPGSVAAPTAGLHFTTQLLDEIKQAGVGITSVTLRVGIGTFRPISTETLDGHVMHEERGEINQASVTAIQETRARGGRVIAVGTTTVRILETAAQDGRLKPWAGETDLFIRPPYKFQTIDGMVTNFHLPCSTLLVLVRTFGGDKLMRRAYEEAIVERYRFYSYGDAMLIV
jgi:S-adenosylmethionine:tRNA ribosyltransferase-isomerase